MKLNYHRTQFVLSAPSIGALPKNNGLEVAFVGASNVGKSSLINAICNQKALARTSSTPGRTQLINIFSVAPYCNLVDLPGYGFAAVPEKLKIQWQKSLGNYIEKRELLAGIVILMDSRHPLKPHDQQMLAWAAESQVPFVVVLTKTDKNTQSEMMKLMNQVNEALVRYVVASEENPDPQPIRVIPVSAAKKRGLEKLTAVLDEWFAPVTERYEELGITDLRPMTKADFEQLVDEEGNADQVDAASLTGAATDQAQSAPYAEYVGDEGVGALAQMIAAEPTKGSSNKQRYSPTARRLGTSKPFVAVKKGPKPSWRDKMKAADKAEDRSADKSGSKSGKPAGKAGAGKNPKAGKPATKPQAAKPAAKSAGKAKNNTGAGKAKGR